MLRPAIFVALIFRTITAIQTFDIPYAMTGGGPGDSTETLAMYIHKTTLDFLDFGYGSALAVLMFVLSMVGDVGLPALHAARARDASRERAEPVACMPLRRRTVVWLAGLVVAVNGFFPAVWILLTSLKTETELMQSRSPTCPPRRRSQNYVSRFTDAAAAALHVEQLRRRDAVDRAVRVRLRAAPPTRSTRLRMPAPQPHHGGAARRSRCSR